MSSNDRYNRQRQPAVPAPPAYDDEIVDDDQWAFDSGVDDAPAYRPQDQAVPKNPQTARQRPAAPSLDGTAAQLDRLRRNIRQSSRPAQQAPAPPVARRTTRPAQQTARATGIQDDHIVDDSGYFDDDPYQPSPPPRQRREAQARPSTTPPQRQAVGRIVTDDAHDRDPYADDPYDGYDAYEDDFSEYDAPRRPARQPRAKPQLTMPAISRPSLPPAIAHADLVNDAPALGIIGAGLASLAGMAILVANRAESLAPEFATHVSASGILENFRDESALWNLPLMAAMFTLMNIVMAWFISPLDRFASRFVLVGALVVQFLAWVAIIRIL